MKFKAFWDKIKYEAVIFAVLAAQAALSVYRNGGIPVNFLTFYLLDYKLGFISRAFIGSVAGLLTRRFTEEWLAGFIALSFLVVYLLLSLLLGKLIRKSPDGSKPATVFLTAVFLFTSFSVKVFIHNIGLLDIYMYLFVLLAAVCLKNKYAVWLVPFFCFAGAATHYGFVLIFFPLIFVLFCYEISKTKPKTGVIPAAAASAAAAIAASVYFVFFSNNAVKTDSAGTFRYLQGKADFPVWRFFVDGILYYTETATGREVDGFAGFMEILKETAVEGFRLNYFAASIVMMTPLFLFFFFIWKGAAKAGAGWFEKTVFVLCIALPLPLLPWFVFSTDTPRFLGEIFVVQFTALFYLLYDQNAAVIESLQKTEKFFKKYPLALVLLLVFSLSAFYFK